MLLARSDYALADFSDAALAQLPRALADQVSTETHAAVLELATGVRRDVAAVISELSALRRWLARELERFGFAAACAGLHPLAGSRWTQESRGERPRLVASSMRFLAHREPTMALHVHIGVPDPDEAVRVLNRIREHIPLLLALSANSPFYGGRDSGFASARTMIFGAFPRTGLPRPFADYADYVQAVNALFVSGALPDPTFLWWDARLQPALGTVEVRAMDAQTCMGGNAPLVAVAQSLALLELEGEPLERSTSPEVLAENRFLAARDGIEARLIDPAREVLVPARALIIDLLARCEPYAAAAGCSAELDQVRWLADTNGASAQRRWVSAGGAPHSIVPQLAELFLARGDPASGCIPRSERSGPCVVGSLTQAHPFC